jgi:tryptophan-rich sensory protein
MNTTQEWYKELIKPSWAPDPSLFGKVWSVLYIMIIIAFVYTCMRTFGWGSGLAGASTNNLWPKFIFYICVFNIFVNLIFTPIQFGLRNLDLALFDIFLVLFSCFALVYYIFPYSKPVSLLLVPYTLWVCIATVLQSSITYLNR